MQHFAIAQAPFSLTVIGALGLVFTCLMLACTVLFLLSGVGGVFLGDKNFLSMSIITLCEYGSLAVLAHFPMLVSYTLNLMDPGLFQPISLMQNYKIIAIFIAVFTIFALGYLIILEDRSWYTQKAIAILTTVASLALSYGFTMIMFDSFIPLNSFLENITFLSIPSIILVVVAVAAVSIYSSVKDNKTRYTPLSQDDDPNSSRKL